jgi:hypothetical protein
MYCSLLSTVHLKRQTEKKKRKRRRRRSSSSSNPLQVCRIMVGKANTNNTQATCITHFGTVTTVDRIKRI